MRICIVSFVFPPSSVGGLERYLEQTTKSLIGKGVKIDVITSIIDKKTIERKDNLTIHRMPFMDVLSTEDAAQRAKKLFLYLKNLIRRKKIDLISAQGIYGWGGAAYPLAINMVALETNTPLVLTVHKHSSTELEKTLQKDLFWDKIVGVSKSITENVYEGVGSVEKLVTVYSGIDTSIFRPKLGKKWLRSRINVAENEILILYAGRISGFTKILLEEKGITTLIKAFSNVIQTYKNVKLLIAVATPVAKARPIYEEALKKIEELVALHNLKDKVIVKAFSLSEMPLVYNGADIFAMASQMEALGLVYSEAMACGLPVIGTSVGGIPEIISNGINGYLVEPNNPVEFSKRLGWLIKDPSRRVRMGKRGRRLIIQKFNVDKNTEKLLGTYRSIIEKKQESKIK